MTIQVDYQPVQYTFEGDWFCDHVGDTETRYFIVDSLDFYGRHYTYEQEYKACGECGEEL